MNRTQPDLQDFVDTATVGLHWVGPDGTILWANPADYQPLGYSEEEYVGHNISEFHAEPDVIADILQRLTQGECLQNYEALLRCKDGGTRRVLITSSVRRGEQGEFLHTRCFTVDISTRRAEGLELQLEALTREVERLRVLASGYSLIRSVRTRLLKSPQDLPALAFTAYARKEDRTRALLAGFQPHLTKPSPGLWLLDDGSERGVDLGKQISAKADGTLLVPVRRLKDLRLSVRVYCEPHGASGARRGCSRAQSARKRAPPPRWLHRLHDAQAQRPIWHQAPPREPTLGSRATDAQALRARSPARLERLARNARLRTCWEGYHVGGNSNSWHAQGVAAPRSA